MLQTAKAHEGVHNPARRGAHGHIRRALSLSLSLSLSRLPGSYVTHVHTTRAHNTCTQHVHITRAHTHTCTYMHAHMLNVHTLHMRVCCATHTHERERERERESYTRVLTYTNTKHTHIHACTSNELSCVSAWSPPMSRDPMSCNPCCRTKPQKNTHKITIRCF